MFRKKSDPEDGVPFDPDSYVPEPTDYGAQDERTANFELWIGGVVLVGLGILKFGTSWLS